MAAPRSASKTTVGAEPLRAVLVPTDHSSGALAAIRRAALLPVGPRSRILLLHVVSAELEGEARGRADVDASARIEKAAAILRRRLGRTQRPDVTIDAEVVHGSPFVEIVRRSRSMGADLVVMGRHGRRPFRDLFIGSTAERVVRKGDVPVLVVAMTPREPYRRPLVATDCEDSFARTCATALRVVGSDVKQMTVFHSYQVPFEARFGQGPSREAVAWQAASRDEATSSVDRLLSTWSGVRPRLVPVIRKGDPRQMILAEAARRNADLIALGTHGRSGIAHVFLGSVAEGVLRAASVDVLVARPVHFTFRSP